MQFIDSPLQLKKTCDSCPEQYEVYDGKHEVGYIRVRHGVLNVDCPFGYTILSAITNGDGAFEGDEQDFWLPAALEAIRVHRLKQNVRNLCVTK